MNSHKFAINAARRISRMYGCEYKVIYNNHLKVVFTKDDKSFNWILPSTPGHDWSMRLSAWYLTKLVNENFNQKLPKNTFTREGRRRSRKRNQ